MSTLSLAFNLPTSTKYTGSGSTTIILQVLEANWKTAKTLIKILRGQGTSRQTADYTDDYDTRVKDLKRLEENLVVRCILEDEDTDAKSAWNKFWQLRAMCTTGGAIATMVWEDKTFTSEVFLEGVALRHVPDDTGSVSTRIQDLGRFELTLTLYMGSPR